MIRIFSMIEQPYYILHELPVDAAYIDGRYSMN